VKQLYLVRHGEAEGHKGRVVGHLDLPLSRAGAHDIVALTGSWRGPSPDRLVASDLRRAADSARLLSGRLGGAPETDSRLRELAFGAWEGMTWDEIYRRDAPHLAAWGERWWEVAPPGGETFDELSRRVLAWFHDFRDEGTGEIVVAVIHSGSLRALLAELLGIPREELFDLQLDYARVSAFEVEEGRCRLRFLNRQGFGG
jgi:broad specificity phosphatase PhoE